MFFIKIVTNFSPILNAVLALFLIQSTSYIIAQKKYEI